MTRLLIAASGTGGHLFPALAVAEAVEAYGPVRWLGVPDRLETSLIPARFGLITVNAGGLQGRGLKRLGELIRLLFASLSVRRVIRRESIDAVFTTGGYIAAPAILAARWCGVPVVLHESNAIPGRVTRLLGRLCTAVAIGLPAAAQRIPGSCPVITGTPVRATFLAPQPLPDWVPGGDGPLLVVMGGSQGAIGLNRMVRAILPKLLDQGCRVVHLTGESDPETNQLHHSNLAERSFSDEIPGLLQHANLVISRAGAGSLSELAVCRTPAVLVPFPQAANHHQEANAACAASFGAAVIVHQHDPDKPILANTIQRLLGAQLGQHDANSQLLDQMQQGMEQLAQRDAIQQLSTLIQQLKR